MGPEFIKQTSKKRSGGSPGPPRDPPGDPGAPRGARTRKNRFADTPGRPRFGHLFRPWTHLGALRADFVRIFKVPAPRSGFRPIRGPLPESWDELPPRRELASQEEPDLDFSLLLASISAPLWHHYWSMGTSRGNLGRPMAYFFAARKKGPKRIMSELICPALRTYNPGAQGHQGQDPASGHSTSCLGHGGGYMCIRVYTYLYRI